VNFAWDEAKNLANQKKHGVSFEEAKSLFAADDYLEVFDDEHSETENALSRSASSAKVSLLWSGRFLRRKRPGSSARAPRQKRRKASTRLTWVKRHD